MSRRNIAHVVRYNASIARWRGSAKDDSACLWETLKFLRIITPKPLNRSTQFFAQFIVPETITIDEVAPAYMGEL